ncbi:hypothetical protein ACQPZA_35240 [Pseudonocardia xinjiangensis]|uniref:hypothetical protein n=1 Tax=Pseudonocardia xinjiangensis TaxID=75289 RepID=UPI003D91E0CE
MTSSVIGTQDRSGVRSSLRMWIRRAVVTTTPSNGVRAALGQEAADQLMRCGRELPRNDGLAVQSEVANRPAELTGLPAVLPERP